MGHLRGGLTANRLADTVNNIQRRKKYTTQYKLSKTNNYM